MRSHYRRELVLLGTMALLSGALMWWILQRPLFRTTETIARSSAYGCCHPWRAVLRQGVISGGMLLTLLSLAGLLWLWTDRNQGGCLRLVAQGIGGIVAAWLLSTLDPYGWSGMSVLAWLGCWTGAILLLRLDCLLPPHMVPRR